MNSYTIKLVSQTNIAILLFLLMIIFFLLLKLTGGELITLPLILALVTGGFLLWKKFVTCITIWSIKENGISIVWKKRFFGTNKGGKDDFDEFLSRLYQAFAHKSRGK